MKLVIAKIGANITFSSNNASAAGADILYFLRQLEIKDHEITFLTKRTRNTVIPKSSSFLDVLIEPSLNGFDALLVFNGSINFFGGAESHELLALYRVMAKTKIPIIYMLTDGSLPMKQLWPLIRERKWAKNYSENEFFVDPANVHLITQGRDKNKTLDLLSSKSEIVKIHESNTQFYPLYRTILAKKEQFFPMSKNKSFKDRDYDLGFGGYVRNTYKKRLIEKYYNDSRFANMLFGNLRGLDAPCAQKFAKSSFQQFIPMMRNCKATVVFGDEYYNDHFLTLRMFESLLAGCIVFVDKNFDSMNYFYDDDIENSDWLYISHPRDIISITEETHEDWISVRDSILNSYDEALERKLLTRSIENATK